MNLIKDCFRFCSNTFISQIDTVNCGIFIDETRKGEWGLGCRCWFFWFCYILYFNVHLIRRAEEKGRRNYSCLMVWGASARPLTLSLSAVFKNAGSWSWATLTSPAYMNSRMAVKCWNGTSFKIMIGCLAGFSSNKAWNIVQNCDTEFRGVILITVNLTLKYGEQADKTILWALQVWPSQANVTSVKDFSSLKCLKEETMLVWKSFHRRQNCCWSPCAIFDVCVCDWVLEKNWRFYLPAKSKQTFLSGSNLEKSLTSFLLSPYRCIKSYFYSLNFLNCKFSSWKLIFLGDFQDKIKFPRSVAFEKSKPVTLTKKSISSQILKLWNVLRGAWVVVFYGLESINRF